MKKTSHDGRIYSLKIVCGSDYSKVAPIVKFVNKINLTCVNQTNGHVKSSFLNFLMNCFTITQFQKLYL